MSGETHIKQEKSEPVNGKTDNKRLEEMTEAEIEANAKSDPDAPMQTDEELEKFKRVNPKEE